MRYSFDYIGHDMWHVTLSDGSYWLLHTDSVRLFLSDYYGPAEVTEIMSIEAFDAVSID